MRIPIPCKGKPFRLALGIRVIHPTTLMLIGRDAEHPNTIYVERKLNFTDEDFGKYGAYKEVRIPFPLVPQYMMFEVWDRRAPDATTFNVEAYDMEPLEPRSLWEQEDIHNFIPFASWFSQHAGYLPLGTYDSPDFRYRLEYLPIIKGDNGQLLVTPARNNRITGRIQASRHHLVPLSVPVRWFICIHERKHFQIPTRNETVADLTALRVFLDFGFPKIEAVYAATKAMSGHSPQAKALKTQRLKDIHAFVDDYMANHTAPQTLRNAA